MALLLDHLDKVGRRGRRRYAELWTNISSKPCWHCSFCGKCYRRGGSTGVSTTRQTHLWFRGWLERWRHELGLEIRSIVIGKDPKYFPEAIVTSISKLIADHRQIKATATHEQRGESMNINTKVEEKTLALHLANFEHNVHVFKQYEALMTDRSRAPHHAIQKYKRNRQSEPRAMAIKWISQNPRIEIMPPSVEIVQIYQDVKKAHIHNHLGGDVVPMEILNWVAPATLQSQTQRGHADLLRVIANERQDNVAIVMMQMTTTRKNKLWLQKIQLSKNSSAITASNLTRLVGCRLPSTNMHGITGRCHTTATSFVTKPKKTTQRIMEKQKSGGFSKTDTVGQRI